MGFFLKLIGLVLVLAGIYGLFVTVPILIFQITVDEINPLITLGLVERGIPPSFFDLLLSIFLIGIGILMIRKKDKEIPIPR